MNGSLGHPVYHRQWFLPYLFFLNEHIFLFFFFLVFTVAKSLLAPGATAGVLMECFTRVDAIKGFE